MKKPPSQGTLRVPKQVADRLRQINKALGLRSPNDIAVVTLGNLIAELERGDFDSVLNAYEFKKGRAWAVKQLRAVFLQSDAMPAPSFPEPPMAETPEIRAKAKMLGFADFGEFFFVMVESAHTSMAQSGDIDNAITLQIAVLECMIRLIKISLPNVELGMRKRDDGEWVLTVDPQKADDLTQHAVSLGFADCKEWLASLESEVRPRLLAGWPFFGKSQSQS